VETAFVWRKGLNELNRPDACRNLFGVGEVKDSRRDRPELRQIAGDLEVERNGSGVDEVYIDLSGHIDKANLSD
jgi:hypothetical protein